jgi:hypothetical protein
VLVDKNPIRIQLVCSPLRKFLHIRRTDGQQLASVQVSALALEQAPVEQAPVEQALETLVSALEAPVSRRKDCPLVQAVAQPRPLVKKSRTDCLVLQTEQARWQGPR